ncbi:MAG: sigma-54-dependent Fis family transcriptional regulator [Deltaproteobacteria bacterium]|nr:MAG: sigma-54-dependent Fis family transcriptional regulator [Deltaproteobacteria bacterium]
MLPKLKPTNILPFPREKKPLLGEVFNHSIHPIVIVDVNYHIIKSNIAFKALFRLNPEQITDKCCFEIINQSRSKCAKCKVEKIFRHGIPYSWKEKHLLPNGRIRHFELRGNPIKDHKGNTVLVSVQIRDISELRHIKTHLENFKEKHRHIVELVNEGILVLDPEAKVTFANRSLCNMLGCRPEEIQNQSLFKFVEADVLFEGKIEPNPARFFNAHEVELIKKNGEHLPCRIVIHSLSRDADFNGSVCTVTDMSHLKAAEENHHSALQFSEKIIDSITDTLIVIDPKTYQIVKANNHFLKRVALKSSEVLEKTCYEILLGRNNPCEAYGIACPVRDAAVYNRTSTVERFYLDAQGKRRFLQISTYPVQDDNGQVRLVIRLEHDLTAKQEMKEALSERTAELEKTHQQLQMLFEISRELTAIGSISALVNDIFKISRQSFPESDIVFLILNADFDGFMALDESGPSLMEPMLRIRRDLENKGLLNDLINFMVGLKHPEIFSSDEGSPPPPVKMISKHYVSWFGQPIFALNQCIGFFLVGSKTSHAYAREDVHIFHSLFAQVGGHIRHLVLHETEIRKLRQQMSNRTSYGKIIGKSKPIQKVYSKIQLVADSDATVLITGENGTGKEKVAQAKHRRGKRRKGPFVVANCTAYAPTLLESELFGHERGAFTGAIHQKKGRIERANGGTLFLDEIGNISPATQVLLLRFLQNHCFERVGGEKTIKADVRVLAATNRDLLQEVKAGRFRSDLYYRLNVVSIHLPPLRERKEDIPLLVQHFVEKYSQSEGKAIREISSDDMPLLINFEWPGNVRQLENAVRHAVIVAQDSVINKSHLPQFLMEVSDETTTHCLAENERRLILQVLQECNWNKHVAARRLGVSRSTLYSKIRRHGIYKEESYQI